MGEKGRKPDLTRRARRIRRVIGGERSKTDPNSPSNPARANAWRVGSAASRAASRRRPPANQAARQPPRRRPLLRQRPNELSHLKPDRLGQVRRLLLLLPAAPATEDRAAQRG